MMMGFGFVGLLIMILFWGGLIVGAVFIVRALFPKGSNTPTSITSSNMNARHILDQRYAQGEITREQYEIMKRDIEP
ncbi:MAG: SHOCT domain-containing protein [Anaerolineales bacterium]